MGGDDVLILSGAYDVPGRGLAELEAGVLPCASSPFVRRSVSSSAASMGGKIEGIAEDLRTRLLFLAGSSALMLSLKSSGLK